MLVATLLLKSNKKVKLLIIYPILLHMHNSKLHVTSVQPTNGSFI